MRPVPGAQQWDRGLRERDDAEEVHVEHPAPVVFGHVLDRPADADARVVDQTLEAASADVLLDDSRCTRCMSSRLLTSRMTGRTSPAMLGLQAVAVFGAAHAGVDGPALGGEPRGARLADPGGGSGDESADMFTSFGAIAGRPG